MELLLINHPLDCPVCDKGGECPLQNQAMSNGRTESRFVDVKRTYPKPLPISSQVLLDRERCVLCARCTRFSQQVAGDPFIELFERGALEQVAIYEDEPFESYFSGNTTQICPVGALTSAQYRFRARPFDLRSEPSVCEHCASGCAQRTDYRRGKVTRRLAGEDPAVNEEWNCDKGRYAFRYVSANDRLTTPLVRRDGELQPASWPEAWAVAAAGLLAAREDGGVGVLPGGRLTVEDAYAYAKFARVALGTNDVDARARAHSAEEAAFLAAAVAGTGPATGAVTYDDLSERLRRPARRVRAGGGVADRLPAAAPGGAHPGAAGLRPRAVRHAGRREAAGHRARPRCPGRRRSRCARSPRAAGADRPSRRCGCRARSCSPASGWPRCPAPSPRCSRSPGRPAPGVAWVPRRAGERGAVEAGALPNLLPGGRGVADAAARAEVAAALGRRPPAVGPRPGHRPASSPRSATGSSSGPARRRRRPGRPARPGARRGGAGLGRLRGQPGDVPERGHRVGRRRPPGRRGRRRRPAATSTGRAGSGPSTPRCTAPGSCPTAACCRASPTRWTSTCACRPPRPRGPSSPRSASARRPGEGAGLDVAPAPAPSLRRRRGGARHLAAAARRRHAAARRARARRHRPPAGGPDRHGRRRAGSASPTATG